MGAWGSTLHEPRAGIMLHYDASASDAGAVAWLTRDPRCRVSYQWLVLDSGAVVAVAPDSARAWHAGVCRPSNPEQLRYADANSAFYGIAIAARAGERATPAQLAAVVDLCHELVGRHGWERELWRIVGHDTEAWERGRKQDPTGPHTARPVLSVQAVREAVQAAVHDGR